MVEIITDSSVLYTEEEAKAAGFEAIPMCVHIGDMEGRDLKIDKEEFYWRIAEGQVPRSSQPPIGDVAEAYERYPEAEILNIAIADGPFRHISGGLCSQGADGSWGENYRL